MSEPSTSFTRVDYTLSGLIEYIELGDIGLPDIQRPFVWTNAKVRDLLDSMYRGFPVGYLLFWKNVNVDNTKQIGVGEKGHKVPQLLIVDGQQRLTSLYAVFRGTPVVGNDYRIEIAFRPRDGRFDVADAAVRRDPEFIPDISAVWAPGKNSYMVVKAFLKQLEAARGELTEEDELTISHNIDRLFDLLGYPFTALEILPTVRAIIDAGGALTPAEIAKETGKNASTIRSLLQKLFDAGVIHKLDDGRYEVLESH